MNSNSMMERRAEALRRFEERKKLIREIAEPMQKTALENPCFTHEENKQAILEGIFSKYLKISNTKAIQVILSISPSDDLTEFFWHISMSIISIPKGVAKSVVLWTKNERQNISGWLVEFLGDVGDKKTQSFGKTAKAMHCYRNLTEGEMTEILLLKGD